MYGYASSPIAFRDLVIVPVGGRARRSWPSTRRTGSVAWGKNDFGNVYSSPILINVDGLEQLAVADGRRAHRPSTRTTATSSGQVPFKADYSIAVATPVWGPDNLLFVSSEYNAGAKGDRAAAQRACRRRRRSCGASNRLRLHHGNAMRIGDTIYFSSGGKGSQAILSAVDARSGKIHWQERSIEKATFVWADQKLITLDQDGNLMIAYPSPQGFKIAAKAPLLSPAVVDAAGPGRHAALPPRSADADGGRPGLSAHRYTPEPRTSL